MAKKGKRYDSMMEKIAAVLGKDVDEVKEMAGSGYSVEQQIYEIQSVLFYYEWRRELTEPKRGAREKEADFNARVAEYEAQRKAFKYKICKGCDREFAYSYKYDSVAYCSLDCLGIGLKRIGLEVHYDRPLELRWGYVGVPAIVPSSALVALEASLKDQFAHSQSELSTSHSTDLPQSHPQPEVPEHSSHTESLHHNHNNSS